MCNSKHTMFYAYEQTLQSKPYLSTTDILKCFLFRYKIQIPIFCPFTTNCLLFNSILTFRLKID